MSKCSVIWGSPDALRDPHHSPLVPRYDPPHGDYWSSGDYPHPRHQWSPPTTPPFFWLGREAEAFPDARR